MRLGRAGSSRATSLVVSQVVIASRRRLSRCAVGAPVVLVEARRCRAHVRKLLSGPPMRALKVTSFFMGAKGLRRWFASLSPGARACAHVSPVPPRARNARAHVLKFLFRCEGVAPIIARFSSVRLLCAQGARPRIAVAGGDGRSADFARRLGIAARGM